MNKLIKLSELHYIIIDDSEIKNKDYKYCPLDDVVRIHKQSGQYYDTKEFKVTHSTEPLEEVVWWERETRKSKLGFDKIKLLSLSEVKEAINGYNVQEMAENNSKKAKSTDGIGGRYLGYIDGFKAHQKLVKDKLFTIDDIFNYSQMICEKLPQLKKLQTSQSDDYGNNLNIILKIQDKFIQLLLPKIEWEIIFDEQGKIKLI